MLDPPHSWLHRTFSRERYNEWQDTGCKSTGTHGRALDFGIFTPTLLVLEAFGAGFHACVQALPHTLVGWQTYEKARKSNEHKPSGRCDWNDVSTDRRSHGPRTPTLCGQQAKERVIVTAGISHGFAPIKDEASIVGSYQRRWLAVLSPTPTRSSSG